MKLDVKSNPGWSHATVGKKSVWTEVHADGPNAGSIQTAAWEPKDRDPGSVTITIKWPDTITGNVNVDLYGTYDGTTYVKLADVGAQVAASTAAGAQSTSIDLNAYPAGKYKVDIHSSADDEDGVAWYTYITE